MKNYGFENRPNILFCLNYLEIQYFINAVGNPNRRNFNMTYIDAVGM
jgi:hypothetical protein